MEEPRVASLQGQEAREPKPPNLIDAGSVAATASASALDNKKRKPNDGGFLNSEYVKVRALVRDLRPFFMEVLHTPDFRNSKAAYEIQKRMQTMMELTKTLTGTASTLNPNKVHDQPLQEAVLEENEDKKVEVQKQTTQSHPGEILAASGNSGIVKKQKEEESQVIEKPETELSKGTFVVGGSPVGWNFLLYPGPKPVYYGRTKESVLASRAST